MHHNAVPHNRPRASGPFRPTQSGRVIFAKPQRALEITSSWWILITFMKHKHHPAFLAILSALSASILVLPDARADETKDEQIDEHFAAADTNHDGQLTLAEAKQGMPRVAANFDKIDTAKHGYVTVEQIKAVVDR